MNRLFLFAGALALGVVVTGSAVSADDKDISIKEIMTKAHKGADSYLRKASNAAKEKDYDALSDNSKELVKLGKDLAKAKPTKGGEASWKKLTSAYMKNTEALATAAKDKDSSGAQKSIKAITNSCGACHKVHQPKD